MISFIYWKFHCHFLLLVDPITYWNSPSSIQNKCSFSWFNFFYQVQSLTLPIHLHLDRLTVVSIDIYAPKIISLHWHFGRFLLMFRSRGAQVHQPYFLPFNRWSLYPAYQNNYCFHIRFITDDDLAWLFGRLISHLLYPILRHPCIVHCVTFETILISKVKYNKNPISLLKVVLGKGQKFFLPCRIPNADRDQTVPHNDLLFLQIYA